MPRQEWRLDSPQELQAYIDSHNFCDHQDDLLNSPSWQTTVEWIQNNIPEEQTQVVTGVILAFSFSKGHREPLGKALLDLGLLDQPEWINDEEVMRSILEFHRYTHEGQANKIPDEKTGMRFVAGVIFGGVQAYFQRLQELHQIADQNQRPDLKAKLDSKYQVMNAFDRLKATLFSNPLYQE